MSVTLAWRVAWKTTTGFTETREDYATSGAAAARAEGLRQDGRDVVVYRIDLEEASRSLMLTVITEEQAE